MQSLFELSSRAWCQSHCDCLKSLRALYFGIHFQWNDNKYNFDLTDTQKAWNFLYPYVIQLQLRWVKCFFFKKEKNIWNKNSSTRLLTLSCFFPYLNKNLLCFHLSIFLYSANALRKKVPKVAFCLLFVHHWFSVATWTRSIFVLNWFCCSFLVRNQCPLIIFYFCQKNNRLSACSAFYFEILWTTIMRLHVHALFSIWLEIEKKIGRSKKPMDKANATKKIHLIRIRWSFVHETLFYLE